MTNEHPDEQLPVDQPPYATDRGTTPATPFDDLSDYVALPRLAGLTMSPDGSRLVVGVSTLEKQKKQRYVTSLWEVDPHGERPAVRLTRGAKGESNPAFTAAGDLLFTAARPGVADTEDEPAKLWLLPRAGGEARVVAERPGGLGGLVIARDSGTLVATSPTLPSASDTEDEERRRTERTEAGISAILHEGYPVRYWDHDLGPARIRLLAGGTSELVGTEAGQPDPRIELTDLTGDVGGAIADEAHPDITPDGTTAVVAWSVPEAHGGRRQTIVAVDIDTGRRRTLLDDDRHEYSDPHVSPDGRTVAALRILRPDATVPPDVDVVVVPLEGGPERVLTGDWDNWPKELRWTPDSAALVMTADLGGRGPVYLLDVASGQLTRLTDDDYTYTGPHVSPDGQWAYALRSSYAEPAHPVRISLQVGENSTVGRLRSPVPTPELPGTLTEVHATAEDGTALRAWLMLPTATSVDNPAPLLLWIHGGPLSSWNSWSWRWNPAVMAARGYAVLLPDPALSTGYGREFIRRGWSAWGDAPYTDLMAITDAALQRGDLDADRTAAMGGSLGGYMANWVAGHTDRFRAIVTHASLWALDQFGRTTDDASYWQREMSADFEVANTPHAHADRISTPMLVIHGDKDYRVPIGEGLRLWWDLMSRSTDPHGATPHRFLYFPDENHWVLTPGNAHVWYETVLAFLAQHVLGKEWCRPATLG